MTALPLKVSGQYVLEYTAENGENRTLARINARDGKWYLSENSSLQIAQSSVRENEKYGECELIPNNLYHLRLNQKEVLALLVEPTNDSRRYYSH